LAWIERAIDLGAQRASEICKKTGISLDVRIISYAPPVEREIRAVVSKWED